MKNKMNKNLNLKEFEGIRVTEEELVLAREKLGDTGKNIPDNELIDQITKMKYLAETWLDDFEKTIFEGKTLNEKLSDKV